MNSSLITFDPQKPVLVTGGTGYVASWLIKTLLDQGYQVRATVRSKAKTEKYQHLLDLAEQAPGSIEIYEADLLKKGSFREAMAGCEVIYHTASPFIVGKIKDPQKTLIDPALEGTRNVLLSANGEESIKRIVLTASVVSMYGDTKDIADKTLDNTCWNTTSSLSHQPYAYSKTLAEKEAWRIAESQNQWDLVTVHPGFVLGPSLTKRKDSASIDFMCSMLNGKFKSGTMPAYFSAVDVRDIAAIHAAAGSKPEAKGRYVAVGESTWMQGFADILAAKYSSYPLPKKAAPTFLLYILGPLMGFSWSYLSKNMGYSYKVDNSPSQKELGIQYHKLENTLLDHAAQIIEDGLV